MDRNTRLFQTVLEEICLDMRKAEQELRLGHLEPVAALEEFVHVTWNLFLANPEFLVPMNSKNLHRARCLTLSRRINFVGCHFVALLDSLLDRGVAEGVFRNGVDPVQLNITIAAVGCCHLSNRFTGTILFGRDLMAPGALERCIAFNLGAMVRLVQAWDLSGRRFCWRSQLRSTTGALMARQSRLGYRSRGTERGTGRLPRNTRRHLAHLPFGKGTDVFDGARMSIALLDRLAHHCAIPKNRKRQLEAAKPELTAKRRTCEKARTMLNSTLCAPVDSQAVVLIAS